MAVAHQYKLMDRTQAGHVIQVLRLSNGKWHCEICGPMRTWMPPDEPMRGMTTGYEGVQILCPHAALCEQSRWSVSEPQLIPEREAPGPSNHKDVSDNV